MAEAAAGSGMSTAQVALRLFPLFFTHVLQAVLVTMPFTVAVYMVRDFTATEQGPAPEATVGRLTGALAATFCATQLLTSYPWGLISDRIGRKPVMLVGNLSCCVTVLWFGLSTNYAQAVASRAVGGFLNAIILAEKTIIGEGLADKATQAKAFGLMSLCWGVGSLAGPVVGGALSAPCQGGLRIDALCGQHSLLVARPYFLPCLLAGVMSAIAAVLVAWRLEETLPSRRGSYQPVPSTDGAADAQPAEVQLAAGLRKGGGSSGGLSDRGGGGEPETKLHAFRGDSARMLRGSGSGSDKGIASDAESEEDFVIFSAGDLEAPQPAPAAAAAAAAVAAAAAAVPWYKQQLVVRALAGYALIAWAFNMLDELTPLFASAAVADGGLGFSPAQLAPSLSFGGAVLICWALQGFPWLLRRVGVVRALRIGLWQSVPMALAIPACSLFGGALLLTQVGMFAAHGFKAVAGTNAFTACLILVNTAAPKASLGAVNGAGQALASAVRALGPALGGLSWAWALQLAPKLPAWLPHQFLPFAISAGMSLGTTLVYAGLALPEEAPAGSASADRPSTTSPSAGDDSER